MSIPIYFDVHTHTQFAAYADDQDAVVECALAAGVWMVNVGTQRDTSASAIAAAERYPNGVYATVGLHPIHTEKSYHDEQELGGDTTFTSRGEDFDYEHYKKLAEHPKVVAIGECGLDYYRLGEETKERQKDAFTSQIKLAIEIKKPLMIHCRNAFEDLIPLVTKPVMDMTNPPGIIHFFTGTLKDAMRLVDIGFLFSFGGVITFARDYDEVVRYIPLDRIVLETDAPYVAPTPYRGKRNEPAYISKVASKIAELKDVSVDEVSTQTVQNAKNIFDIS